MILTKKISSPVDLDLLITEKIKAGKTGELLRIVPTNRKIRTLKRETISSAPGKAAGSLNLETIGTFSTRILLTDEQTRLRVLSEAASATLMKQSFQETGLKYFSDYGGEIPWGTLDRILNVISEYKKHGITPAMLREEARGLGGSEKNKAEDIAGIYETYNGKCNSLNVMEIGDIYAALNSLDQDDFRVRFRILFPEVDLIIVSGFDEFTSPEIEILNKLSGIENADQYISFDYYLHNSLIFSNLDKCYDKLTEKGFSEAPDISLDLPGKFALQIKEKLFKKNKSQIGEFEDNITVLPALNREREIAGIAKEIKNLLLQEKVKPNTICVVFNLIQNYSSLIRDIFNLYGLPYNLTDRYSLKTSSPVIAVVNFLEILENDFYYKNILRALSSGFLDFSGIEQSALLKASVNLKIISGYENWRGSLSDAIKRCDDSEEETASVLLEKELYKKALKDIETLAEYLKPFKRQLTLRQFLDGLKDLIFSVSLPEKLINSKSIAVEENIKAVNTFIEEINEVFKLLEREYGKDKKFPLTFFLNNLKTIMSTSRYNIKEKPGYGVQVTTLNEIRGLHFDYIFAAGMCDGDLPTKYTPEIFLSGSYSRNEKIHQTEERYHFYQTLCSWDKHLYLTYPLQEERKEFVRSNLLGDFLSLFKTKNKSEEDYADTVYSREDLLVHSGRAGVKKAAQLYGDDLGSSALKNLEKTLEINRIRSEAPFGESEYTGIIKNALSAEANEKLGTYKDRQYSISQLETYAKCPYKYFAERILKLKPVSEPTEDIEALEMGSLLHMILFRFYSEVKKRKIIIADSDGKQFGEMEELLFKTAADSIEKAGFNSPINFFEKEKILGINGERKNSILYKFLIAEKENKDGFIPEFFEIGFGDSSGPANYPVNLKAGKAELTGKIDRIDIKEETGKYKVVDYKLSGKKPSALDLETGLSLQLPLYLYAAKELIKAQLDKDMLPAGAEIYSLKYDKDDFGKKAATYRSRRKISEEEKENEAVEKNLELIDICLEMIEKYVRDITEGRFNLSILPNREKIVCGYCDFRPVCRIREAD